MNLLSILQHALGRDEYGIQRRNNGVDYRNHVCVCAGTKELVTCRQAVSDGLMREHPPSPLSGGDHVFTVTPKGIDYINLNSPPEPRLTRGQLRYREYLSYSDYGDMTFGEWLKWRHKHAKNHSFWESQ